MGPRTIVALLQCVWNAMRVHAGRNIILVQSMRQCFTPNGVETYVDRLIDTYAIRQMSMNLMQGSTYLIFFANRLMSYFRCNALYAHLHAIYLKTTGGLECEQANIASNMFV